MRKPHIFDSATDAIGLNRGFDASKISQQVDPGVPFAGLTFGVASMSENSPHDGERHPDGDEILYLISGRVRVVFVDSGDADIDVNPGDGIVIPKGLWHRVDILEPSEIVYLTPGPNNEYRALPNSS